MHAAVMAAAGQVFQKTTPAVIWETTVMLAITATIIAVITAAETILKTVAATCAAMHA